MNNEPEDDSEWKDEPEDNFLLDESGWDYVPEDNKKAYTHNGIDSQPLENQLGYWRERCKYFESKTFYFKYLLDKREEMDESEWWKKDNQDDNE